MANDNNKSKELVSGETDPGAEFESPRWRDAEADTGMERSTDSDFGSMKFDPDIAPIRNRDAVIQDLKAELRIKTETIDRLQFDVERLRSRRICLDTEIAARAEQTRKLATAVDDANRQIDTLTAALHAAKKSYDDLAGRLEAVRTEHEEELRCLRFELTEAADTVTRHELINEQLASDLVDTRGFKSELERMFTSSEEHNQQRIAQLEATIETLRKDNAEFKRVLSARNAAIAELPGQISGNSRQDESARELAAAIEELDVCMSEHLVPKAGRDRHRMSRVLIGSFDNQELRFPLFKKRLTIGRTEQNDIQLQAPHISRRHAVVMTEGDVTRVIDWGSKNGVYVNSNRVTEHFLASGDVVTIGDARFRYEERPKRDASAT
jgi:predicted RNase H-like nuclease (RuvC/YqgF family)